MFPTSLTEEYRILHEELAVPRERLHAMALSGVDACWPPGPEKAALRTRVEAELAALPA